MPSRFAIVTGAASGLGREFALRLARDGWHVAIADINRTGSEETLRQIHAIGGTGQVEMLDVASGDSWRELCNRLRSEWPRLDLLVNNAGLGAGGELADFSIDDWNRLIGVNLLGVAYGCHTMIAWLRANSNNARIINVASIAAWASLPGMAAYNASKAGVISLSETLSQELQPDGIGVTVVLPSFFASDLMQRGIFRTSWHQAAAMSLVRKSRNTVEQVASAALDASRRGKLYCHVGDRASLVYRLKRFFPNWFLRKTGETYRKFRDRRLAKEEHEATIAEERRTTAIVHSGQNLPDAPHAIITPGESANPLGAEHR